MDSLSTVFFFLCAVLIAGLCGYSPVRFLVPSRYQEYRFLIMPAVGFPVVCWLSFVLSSILRISTSHAVWVALAVLMALNALAFVVVRPRDRWANLVTGAKKALMLGGAMLVVIQWPLFYIGAETYLGTVNPDYFFQFMDNHYLRNHVSTTQGDPTPDRHHRFYNGSQRLVLSGRFIGEVYQLVLENTLRLKPRTALTLSIAIFLFCLPLTVYFMVRVAFGLPEPVGWISAVLTGISAPISLSFVAMLVGQNSALPVVPLLLGLLYVLIVQQGFRVVLLCAILISCFLLMYAPMLPYAAVPVAGAAVDRLLRGRLPARHALTHGLALVGCSVVPLCVFPGYVRQWADSWVSLLSGTFQGVYFIDYLTEQFFPLFFGLASYTIPSSSVQMLLGTATVRVLTGVSALLLIALCIAFVDWVRRYADRSQAVMVASGIVVFTWVWWGYCFGRQYGYALFKMASWLQFFLLPGVAYGIWRLYTAARSARSSGRRRALAVALVLSVIVFAGSNLLASLDYGYKSLGRSPLRGQIVNSFGVSGNEDYLELEPTVPRFVKREESVGLAFSDAIQNDWVAYYLRDSKVSILSHIVLPGDDERLPNPITRRVISSAGTLLTDDNDYFNGNSDSFYLTLNPGQFSSEIVEMDYPTPIWKNRTFQLLRADDVRDFMVLGRGFYRLELDVPREYWWPGKFRWTAEGGEFHIFRPAAPGQPYQISFWCFTGYGLASATRNLEFWHNGMKFDEQQVHGHARVVSKPFYPTGKLDRIVVRIPERVPPVPRPFGLYNRQVPFEYRSLSMAMSGVRLISPVAPKAAVAGSRFQGGDLFARALHFNGIEPDLWVREQGEISLPRPACQCLLRISMVLPDRPEYRFPFGIELEVDAVRRTYRAAAAGSFTAEADLPPVSGQAASTIRIKPAQHFLPYGYDHQLRPMAQSVRLEAVDFQCAEPARPAVVSPPSRVASEAGRP